MILGAICLFMNAPKGKEPNSERKEIFKKEKTSIKEKEISKKEKELSGDKTVSPDKLQTENRREEAI